MSSAAPLGTQVNARVLKGFILSERQEALALAETLNELRRPVNEAIAKMNADFDAANAELMDALAKAENAAIEHDKQLRDLTVQYFEETGEKHLDADCSVRVSAKYQYETAEAVKWAETNAPVMIVKSVDKKSFESLPNVAELDFVQKVETATAVIAKTFTEV